MLSEKARRQLVNSLIISRLSYRICMWGNLAESTINKGQVVLNAAARFVSGLRKSTQKLDLMNRCGWLTIEEMTRYFSLVQMWKSCRLNVPIYFTGKVSLTEDDLVSTGQPRLQFTAGTYRWKSVEHWNNLPEFLRGELRILRFKKGVRKFIIEERAERLQRRDDSDLDSDADGDQRLDLGPDPDPNILQ